MNADPTQPGPPDRDHDPEESQGLGPAIKKPKPAEEEGDRWYKTDKPGLEVNKDGQYRYRPLGELL